MANQKKPDQCDACFKAFKPDPVSNKFKWLVVENFKLHPECFCCRNCNQAIDQSQKYHKKDDGSFLCINCTQQSYGGQAQLTDQSNAGQCKGCFQPIGGNWVQDAQGNSFHNDCFKCLNCSKNLANTEEGYSAVGDKIFCKNCRQQQLDNK
eukprot:421596_1